MNEFTFIGIDNNPFKAEGKFVKEDDQIKVFFDSAGSIRRFEGFKDDKTIIEQIGFFYKGNGVASYYGPYIVEKIKDNEVTLKVR